MKAALPLLGLFAVLLVGMICPVMAETAATTGDYSSDVKRKYDEKRQAIEKHYQIEFENLEKQYSQVKMEIYNKIEANPNLLQSEIDSMFNQFIAEFDKKRKNLESMKIQEFNELDKMFKNEIHPMPAKPQSADSTKSDYAKPHPPKEPYLNDPQWKTIEPMAQKIMDAIPMEKIQSLWESGQIDRLLELIVSETDLTYDEAKRVVSFFEKYDNRHYDDKPYYNDKPYHNDTPYYDNKPQYAANPTHNPQPNMDDGLVIKLEQRIGELEKENKELREYNSQLEQKIAEINAIVLEQIKIIYNWVITK